MRVSALMDAGASRHTIATARECGTLVRVTRGWVALPGADDLLVGAARRGVVLTCVTQAARLGLWVLASGPRPHVGASPHAGRAPTQEAVVHRHRPLVPRHPDHLVDPVENVLLTVAHCQPFEAGLAVWESALRQGLVSALTMRRLALPSCARRLLDAADVWSDSGLETLVLPRLRWMRLPLRRQVWIAGHRVDLLIGDRLVLQIDGAHHTGAQRDEDIAHDATLTLMGYHVIRVSYRHVVDDWASVQDTIMRAVAQGLHRAR
ncbi:hypothetical protein GCM10009724_02300 [Microbacterium lacticum]|nr:hypothetical protein MLA01_09170 [Microbacterium lacticum]GGN12484.1 hypothetical protein GCM10009724_02300 [Microbacterium lacticum]